MVERIKELIKEASGTKRDFPVFFSERPEFGNYSTNAPFLLATLRGIRLSSAEVQAQGKRNPMEIAKELAEKIKAADKEKLFSKVEAAAPGYVNFWLSGKALITELEKALKAKRYKLKAKSLKINLEFVSANPTGPLTMANGRGGFWGDALANVLEFAGHKVVREYYINDAGNQMKILGESVLAALGRAPEKEEHYKGDYIKERAEEIADKIKNETNLQEIGWQAAIKFLKNIKTSLENAGIRFDVWFSEFDNLRGGSPSTGSGLIKKVLRVLEKSGAVYEKDGAKWFKAGDRVLVKSDKEPTYLLADIAYHYHKLVKRKFDKAINIWGADHHGNVAPLKDGVKAIGVDPERLKIIIVQLVRLVEGGKEAKMSKRKGEFVTLDELIADVGKDATRFFFLMNTPSNHMDFDLALAREKSMKNPVYYAQYAYVRCRSILQKAKSQIFNFQFSIFKQFPISKLQKLQTESELSLLRELVKFEYMVKQTAEDYQVNRLVTYVLQIARAFHYFYEKERVLPASPVGGEAEKEIKEARLALVAATRTILKKLFDLLGISAPEKM